MQSSTFAIMAPRDHFRLILFLKSSAYLVGLKHNTIPTSVTLEVTLTSTSSNLHSVFRCHLSFSTHKLFIPSFGLTTKECQCMFMATFSQFHCHAGIESKTID